MRTIIAKNLDDDPTAHVRPSIFDVAFSARTRTPRSISSQIELADGKYGRRVVRVVYGKAGSW